MESSKPHVQDGSTTIATRRVIIASIVGNGLEYFDFIMYGYFATIIASVFFPNQSSYLSITLTLATFAVGFFVRPLGGVLFGLYADRVGRQRALTLLITLMACSTLLVGITPGYAQIGIAAPAIIVFARLLQGLSVGGEFSTSTAMLTEYAPANRKMYFGSFQMVAQAVALMLSSAFSYGLTVWLSIKTLEAWGWRIPFLAGALVGPVGFYIRHSVAESPEFLKFKKNVIAVPRVTVRAFWSTSKRSLFCGLGVISVGTATNFLLHANMSNYVVHQLKLPLSSALMATLIAALFNLVGFCLAGKAADRYGAYRVFFYGVVGWAIVVIPLFSWVTDAPTLSRLIISQLIGNFFLVIIAGPSPGMLAELFSIEMRSTGSGLAYNIAVMVFGGLAPLATTLLAHLTGSSLTPAFFIAASAIFSLVLVLFTRPTTAVLRLGSVQ